MRRYLIITCVLLAGCVSKPPMPRPDPITRASEGVAGIVAHTESAERHVQHAMPLSPPTAKAFLVAASEEHTEVISDAAETRTALVRATLDARELRNQVADRDVKYAKLESKWFVRWGRWIERALWILGISWLLLGVASVVFGLGNPLSWSWRIGKEITRFSPLMNPFSWIRDWLAVRKAKK